MDKYIHIFSARKFADFANECKNNGSNDFNDIELKKYGYYFYNLVNGSYYWRKWK